MGMKRFTRSEKTEVLTPQQHEAVSQTLHGLGKRTAKELSEDERQTLQNAVENSKPN